MNTPASRSSAAAVRVLVVRLSAIGDCVHALPAVRRLCSHPGVEVGWAIEHSGWRTVRDLVPEVQFHHFPRRARGLDRWRATRRFRRHLRSAGYDVLLDLQGNAKSAWVGLLSGVSLRLGPSDGRELNHVALHERYPIGERRHVVERHLDAVDFLLQRLDLEALSERPLAQRLSEACLSEGTVPSAPAGGRVLLCPATTWKSKHWPVTHYADLAGRLAEAGWQVEVFWGGAEERRLAEELCRLSGDTASLSPDLQLEQLASHLAGVQLVIGNDTGPVHLAADLGVATVSLHGPTPVWRNGARGLSALGLEVDDPELTCQPCWKGTCARGDLACLERLRADTVLEACGSLLSKPTEHRREGSE